MSDIDIHRSDSLCRHCERTIWLFVDADGSLDPDHWTADDRTIVCHGGVNLDEILLHKPLEPERTP